MSGRVHASVARHSGVHDDKHVHLENHLFDKTRLCKFFAKGKCARGLACTFAHSHEELETRPDFFRTQLCPDFLRLGMCPLGASCAYAHNTLELRRPMISTSHHTRLQTRRVEQNTVGVEAQQLELMQQQVLRLHSQMQELEVLTARRRAPRRTNAVLLSSCSSQVDESEGLGCPAESFSRQTTAEGDDDSLAPWSRQTSNDNEACEGEAASPQAAEAAEPCELVVRRTFCSLEPPCTEGLRRRSKSAPPGAAHFQGSA